MRDARQRRSAPTQLSSAGNGLAPGTGEKGIARALLCQGVPLRRSVPTGTGGGGLAYPSRCRSDGSQQRAAWPLPPSLSCAPSPNCWARKRGCGPWCRCDYADGGGRRRGRGHCRHGDAEGREATRVSMRSRDRVTSATSSPLGSPAALSRSERPRHVDHTAGRTDALVICR